MLVSEFDFDLPPELIAQTPAPRGESRLMTLERATGAVHHGMVADLPSWLNRGDLLVVNDTRVFPARLIGRRVPSGGTVECLLLARATDGGADDRTREAGRGAGWEVWDALVHPGQKLKPGAQIRFEGPDGALVGEVLERRYYGRRRIRIRSETGGSVDELVDAIGHVPLPPYIHRPDSADDLQRYQTVYAETRGSVAAPTAGLHFSKQLLAALAGRGVERAALTLHVGYGTFKPVRAETVEGHEVDSEQYVIPEATARAVNAARVQGRRVVAVGTTTTRALEDAAQKGGGSVAAASAQASLFIHPGFTFSVVGGLFTNFHLPRSSLLMLVSAFAGRERVLAAYREAIAHGYRFYSYGDAMLIV